MVACLSSCIKCSFSPLKCQLTDVEYSDLEDISPGRLSLDKERPTTPGTPETATPAPDFTHPSLGFWAAPLRQNEMAKPTATVVPTAMIAEDCKTTEAVVLSPRAQLGYSDDYRVPYVEEESSIHKDPSKEPFITPGNWPG